MLLGEQPGPRALPLNSYAVRRHSDCLHVLSASPDKLCLRSYFCAAAPSRRRASATARPNTAPFAGAVPCPAVVRTLRRTALLVQRWGAPTSIAQSPT